MMKSNNNKVINGLLSKSEHFKLPENINYIIIYSFLFKYCSDNLKDYLVYEISDEELTLDEAYEIPEYQNKFKTNSLNIFGYYIEKPQAFFDEIRNNCFLKDSFLKEFFTLFSQNIIFDLQREKAYFDYLFKVIDEEINVEEYVGDEEINRSIKEVIHLISKLDIFEEDLTFKEAFDIIAGSELMKIKNNDENYSKILSSLVSCQKNYVYQVYDPFLNNGESIIKLARECELGLNKIYAKEEDKLTYCFNIVKLYLNNFNLANVYLKQENAFKSIDIEQATFDVILSKIPSSINDYAISNVNHDLEILKRSRKNDIEGILLENFPVSDESLIRSHKLNKAMDNLLETVDFSDVLNDFDGEYESLMDSEFLFLINLIDCLKNTGIMAVSISHDFLFKNSLKILRKYITYEKNYIEAIIRPPDWLKNEVIIIFKKNRLNKNVLFIDMSDGGKNQKNDMNIDNSGIAKMCDVFSNRVTVDKYSKIADIGEISKNDFDLSVSLYVDTLDEEFIKLEDLLEDKKSIDLKISELNSQIKKLMDELNINI